MESAGILIKGCTAIAKIPKVEAGSKCQLEPFLQGYKPFSASSPTLSSPPVLHSASDLEFSINFPSHAPAYLKYRYITPTSVNMYTTMVPSTLEGKGVAKLLANAAFDWAVENKLEMKLTCWYLAGYLKRNPRDDAM